MSSKSSHGSRLTAHGVADAHDLQSAIIQKYGTRNIPMLNRKLYDATGITIGDRYLAMIIRGERKAHKVEVWLRIHFATELSILAHGRKAIAKGNVL